MTLDVDVGRGASGPRIEVRGEVDLDSSPRLLAHLQDALRGAAPGEELAVHLAAVQYIDSSGVAILIQAFKQAGRRKVKLVLVEPSARVDGVLELAQLHGLFEIRRAEPGRG